MHRRLPSTCCGPRAEGSSSRSSRCQTPSCTRRRSATWRSYPSFAVAFSPGYFPPGAQPKR